MVGQANEPNNGLMQFAALPTKIKLKLNTYCINKCGDNKAHKASLSCEHPVM